MKKLISILIIFVLMLFSCSDETRWVSIDGVQVPEGSLRIDLSIPEISVISSRSDESSVSSISVLFFNLEGDLIQNYTTSNVSSSSEDYISIQFPLIQEVKELPNEANIYILANISTQLEEFLTEGRLEQLTETYIDPGSLGMSWKGNKGDIANNRLGTSDDPVKLRRNVAKITVTSIATNFHLKEFVLVNSAKEGYVTAPWNNKYFEELLDDPIGSSGNEALGEMQFLYCFPTNSDALILVNGEYKEVNYWYKLDLKKNNPTLKIEPNHWYKVIITEIKGPGYAIPNYDKWNSQDGLVEYLIEDTTPGVLSMISDGIRELGTSGEINLNNTSQLQIHLSCIEEIISGNQSGCLHIPDIVTEDVNSSRHSIGENFSVEIIEGSGWLNLEKVDVSRSSETSSSELNPTYTLRAKGNLTGGNMSALIRVIWQGLSRDISVSFISPFSPKEIFRVTTLIIYEGQVKYEIDDYWKWLAGENRNVNKEENSKRSATGSFYLKGVQTEVSVNGSIRNQGLHFPMPYGDLSNPNWYEYQLGINNSSDPAKNYKYFSVDIRSNEAEVWDDSNFIISTATRYTNTNSTVYTPENESKVKRNKKTELVNVDEDAGLFLVLRRAKGEISEGKLKNYSGIIGDYTYSTAELVITFYRDDYDLEGTRHTLNLYHTGFFHNPNITVRGNKGNNYYYYEVVEMGEDTDGEPFYWLDRNVGASSNANFIDLGNGSYMGQPEARGLFINISDQAGGLKVMDEVVCPTGYHVPNMTEWTLMMRSSSFNTNTDVGNVYFPRGMYANPRKAPDASRYSDYGYYNPGSEDTEAGDGGAGYYWTRTEDKEGGFNVLKFSENTYAIMHGDVSTDWMSLRCIAGNEPLPEIIYEKDLYIKGATHIYLFTVDGTPLFPYPGKEIATPKAVRNLDYSKPEEYRADNSFIAFHYNDVTSLDKLYAIFLYKDETGRVTIISKNQASTLKEAQGWKLSEAARFYFYWDIGFSQIIHSEIF